MVFSCAAIYSANSSHSTDTLPVARLKTGPACSFFFEKILLFINRLCLIKSAIRGPVPTLLVNQVFWFGFFVVFLLFFCHTSRVVCWIVRSCSECSTLVFNSTSVDSAESREDLEICFFYQPGCHVSLPVRTIFF